ncbi:MAG: sensor histidine kinase [Longimicrobiales bacterium]
MYMITFLIEPITRIQNDTASIGYIVAMALGLLVFLVAFFRGYWVHGRRLIPIIGFITALGIGYAPFNVGSSVLFVYAGAFAGFLPRQRDALRALALVVLCALLTALAIGAPGWFYITGVGITLIVGGVNLHFAQAGRAQHRLRMAQEEVEHMATLAERERIARDLHDVLGHTLSLIVLKSELAARLAQRDPGRAASEMRDVEDVARRTLQDVREAIRGYHTTLADEAQRAGAMLKAASMTARFDFEHVTLARSTEEALALALREAVTNVVRHSAASSCRISLAVENGHVVLVVQDDGHGSSAADGAGLQGMRSRIESCAGTVERSTGRGLRLRIAIPAGERAADATCDTVRSAS